MFNRHTIKIILTFEHSSIKCIESQIRRFTLPMSLTVYLQILIHIIIILIAPRGDVF